MRDPTFKQVARGELEERGYTCADCVHWLKLSTGEELCAIDCLQFPSLCDAFDQRVERIGNPRGH